MHIDSEALTSAVAITVGMNFHVNGNMLYDWAGNQGLGGVEMYHEIGQLAALSSALANAVAGCEDFVTAGFPGVYAYEVDEAFGNNLVGLIHGQELDDGYLNPVSAPVELPGGVVVHLGSAGPFNAHIVRETLGRLATEFFDQVRAPIPHADAIIHALTGFDRAKALQLGWTGRAALTGA